MQAFYLGTHQPAWLQTANVALFVSHRRLAQRKTLPRAVTGWALDSGGFSELSLYGRWRTSARQYSAAVRRYDDEIGRLEWAAPQDLMTEPDMLRRTGLTIREHQKRTVANFCELQNLWTGPQDSPYMPVLQGWSIDDYLHCMDAYYGAGINLALYPLVGVGSICRRQGTKTIKDVVNAILRLDPDMPLHTFGAKSKGLRLYGHRIASADSLAWSFQARRNPPMRDTATRPAPTACPTPSGGAASCCPHCRRAFSHRNSEKRNEWQAKAIPPRAWPRNWSHRLQMYSGNCNSAQSIAFTFAIAYYRIRQKPLIKKGMK